jgi:phage tail-like protein
MTTTVTASPSSLAQFLPAIYQSALNTEPFLGQFLLAFEKILLGPYEAGKRGLEEKIADLHTTFEPLVTDKTFLPWLADWAAFTLRNDLDEPMQRQFLANIIQLYKFRGTKKNLQDLLGIFTRGQPTVTETAADEFEIGVHSTVGVDTYVAGGSPHYFIVTVSLARDTVAAQQQQERIARALIDLEKPAHTAYDLHMVFPSMQIGKHSTVGIDTLLGTAE